MDRRGTGKDGEPTTLGDLVTADPAAARLLDSLGIDYCCGGHRTLDEACDAVGLDADGVRAVLADRPEIEPADWATLGIGALADHVEATHHRYLHDELPHLSALADKVLSVHGERHPELSTVRDTFEELRADLGPHLLKEERVLFPMVRELDAATTATEFHCGSLRNPLRVMLVEHDRAGELLRRLRDSTGGYRPPSDACTSYQALYAGLEELEHDTHLHVHKENNVLFPAVLEREAALTEGTS